MSNDYTRIRVQSPDSRKRHTKSVQFKLPENKFIVCQLNCSSGEDYNEYDIDVYDGDNTRVYADTK